MHWDDWWKSTLSSWSRFCTAPCGEPRAHTHFSEAAFRCSWPLPKTFAVTGTLPTATDFRWWTAFPSDPHRKALKWLESLHCKGLSRMQFPVVARASVALFQVLPCQTSVCGEKKSHKTQESVKLYSQRRGRAKICHKQTDQPGAHINGLPCCVPTAGLEGYFAYHYCSYTKHSSAAAEHCKVLQQGDFLYSFF